MSESQTESSNDPIDLENRRGSETEALLGRLAKPPAAWICVMLVAAVLAALDVKRSTHGDYAIGFHVRTASLVALALIWLPLLLRVFALVGGSFKAAGVEASVRGVLPQADAIEISVKARQVASAGDDVERRVAAQDLEELVNRLAVATDREVTLADSVLEQLGREYERLRRELPPGSRRTAAMTRVVNEARARAALAPRLARGAASGLLRSHRAGDRIVALGLAQETGNASAFDDVLRIILGSASAFEMFHALLALQEMSFGLSESQKRSAIDALNAEREDPRSVGINQDPGLPSLMSRTIEILSGAE
jgi:hypothetical protein